MPASASSGAGDRALDLEAFEAPAPGRARSRGSPLPDELGGDGCRRRLVPVGVDGHDPIAVGPVGFTRVSAYATASLAILSMVALSWFDSVLVRPRRRRTTAPSPTRSRPVVTVRTTRSPGWSAASTPRRNRRGGHDRRSGPAMRPRPIPRHGSTAHALGLARASAQQCSRAAGVRGSSPPAVGQGDNDAERPPDRPPRPEAPIRSGAVERMTPPGSLESERHGCRDGRAGERRDRPQSRVAVVQLGSMWVFSLNSFQLIRPTAWGTDARAPFHWSRRVSPPRRPTTDSPPKSRASNPGAAGAIRFLVGTHRVAHLDQLRRVAGEGARIERRPVVEVAVDGLGDPLVAAEVLLGGEDREPIALRCQVTAASAATSWRSVPVHATSGRSKRSNAGLSAQRSMNTSRSAATWPGGRGGCG